MHTHAVGGDVYTHTTCAQIHTHTHTQHNTHTHSHATQIIFIDEGLLRNLVVLDPAWLGRSILGPALTPHTSLRPQLNVKSVTGRSSLSDIQKLYAEWDAVSVARIFEHFELCVCGREDSVYEFPCLLKMQPLYGLWVKDPGFTVYAGLYLECSDRSDIFRRVSSQECRCWHGRGLAVTILTTRSLPSGPRGSSVAVGRLRFLWR